MRCAENFAKHVGVPRGCQDEVKALFETLGVEVAWDDQRLSGSAINVAFQGKLYLEQQVAADSLLAHDTGVLAATTAFGKTVIGAYFEPKAHYRHRLAGRAVFHDAIRTYRKPR